MPVQCRCLDAFLRWSIGLPVSMSGLLRLYVVLASWLRGAPMRDANRFRDIVMPFFEWGNSARFFDWFLAGNLPLFPSKLSPSYPPTCCGHSPGLRVFWVR